MFFSWAAVAQILSFVIALARFPRNLVLIYFCRCQRVFRGDMVVWKQPKLQHQLRASKFHFGPVSKRVLCSNLFDTRGPGLHMWEGTESCLQRVKKLKLLFCHFKFSEKAQKPRGNSLCFRCHGTQSCTLQTQWRKMPVPGCAVSETRHLHVTYICLSSKEILEILVEHCQLCHHQNVNFPYFLSFCAFLFQRSWSGCGSCAGALHHWEESKHSAYLQSRVSRQNSSWTVLIHLPHKTC